MILPALDRLTSLSFPNQHGSISSELEVWVSATAPRDAASRGDGND
jgi:hypothetical protein